MLLFLHGFLGCKEDWNPVLNYLNKGMAIDLPVGERDIALAIKHQFGNADTIVGYSAGGRIALEMKSRFPDCYGKVIAISAHPGLISDSERDDRKKRDQVWIDLLENNSYELFLQKWYAQPLFSSLKASPDFGEMMKRRIQGDPKAWAHFLKHHSLGQKPIPRPFSSTIYIYGSEDLKYANLYRKLNSYEIKNCGHSVHIEQPKACARIIEQ